MKTLWIAVRALVYEAGFVALWAWLAYQAHLYDGRLGIALPAWTGPVGIALMVLGSAIVVGCVATFVIRGRGTPAPFDAPRAFVATGPYRWVRNPMYLGFFALLAGYALCAGSVAAFLVSLAMLTAAHLFVVLYEEPNLEERFGEAYLAYRRTTARWLPRPPRS